MEPIARLVCMALSTILRGIGAPLDKVRPIMVRHMTVDVSKSTPCLLTRPFPCQFTPGNVHAADGIRHLEEAWLAGAVASNAGGLDSQIVKLSR
ncbi:hypothetical protein EDD15DRAFT_870946 [Pisolithus albus]|nr:hypothetical protein EDD15DRAFT_870946 [Pisolithus albus]